MSDRPLRRKLIRLGALVLGPSRAHRQDIWPGLSIDARAGLARWKRQDLCALRPFRDLLPEGPLSIVGSGPSLRDQHVERLTAPLLLNGAASLADRVTPAAVVVEDERFIFRHHAMIAALPHDVPLLLSPAAMRAIAERGPATLQDRPVGLIDNLAKPVNQPRRALSDPDIQGALLRKDGAALSIDPDTGMVITGTVAFSALQIALSLLPPQVLLAGVDLSNANAPRFYEDQDRAKSGIVSGLDRILPGFALALQFAHKRGIDLRCASAVSALLDLGYPYDPALE